MLIYVTNITRDILGYKNNTIVFFSTQGMSTHQPPYELSSADKIWFRNSEVCRDIRHWPKLLYLNSINFTPIQSFDYLAKTTLALGACSEFQNLKGSVLYLSDAFREQEWITERGASSALSRVQTLPSSIFFSLVCHVRKIFSCISSGPVFRQFKAYCVKLVLQDETRVWSPTA